MPATSAAANRFRRRPKTCWNRCPGTSFAAISATEYGKRLQEGIDSLDAAGIPGQVPPHQLKSLLRKEGIDLEEIAGSLEDAAVFAVGGSKSTLGGALVLTTKNATEAKNTVANIGLLLRSNHTPGVTAIGGKAAGFSIHSAEIGPKPLVIAAKGDRIAIGYGLPATLEGLGPAHPIARGKRGLRRSGQGARGDADQRLRRRQRRAAPGRRPGVPVRLRLPRKRSPISKKIDYIGIGGGSEGDLATLKLIVGLGQ